MQELTFLGQGWSFPPAFLRGTNSAVLSKEEENVRQNIKVLIDTRLGERIMKFDYGTDLQTLVFQKKDSELFRAIQATLRKAILYYEPRVDLADIIMDPAPHDPEVVMIQVIYTVRTTNSRMNFVYPFHLKEGTYINSPA